MSEPNHTTLLNATIHSIASISIFDKVLEISCESACVLPSWAAIFVEAGRAFAFFPLVEDATSPDAHTIRFGESYIFVLRLYSIASLLRFSPKLGLIDAFRLIEFSVKWFEVGFMASHLIGRNC